MIEKLSPYFDLQELVCPHVHKAYGTFAWNFLNDNLVELINTIRERIGRPIYVNNWHTGGKFDERGFRCIQCDIVKNMIESKQIYVSAHMTGKGVDFDVEGLVAEETREWLKLHKNWWPYKFRLESNVNWVHLDLYNLTDKKIIEFT
jgi:hypothetical protein